MFRGSDPYGTPGGQDTLSVATEPPDVRLAIARTVIAYLRVNGELTIRDMSALEVITRVVTNPTGGQMAFFDSFTIGANSATAGTADKVIGSKSVVLPTGNWDMLVVSNFRAYGNSSAANTNHEVRIGGNGSGKIPAQHDGGVDSGDLQFHYRNTVTGTVLVETVISNSSGSDTCIIPSGRVLIVAFPSP